jgi:hypothetical protein
VLPRALDGTAREARDRGPDGRVRYRVGARGFGRGRCAQRRELAFERGDNPYREGGARVAMARVRERCATDANTLVVELG